MIIFISRKESCKVPNNSNSVEGLHLFSSSAGFDQTNQCFGELLAFGDYRCRGSKFPYHPHENLELVIIQLEGALQYQDSLGNNYLSQKGDVRVISTATGYSHGYRCTEGPARFIAMWLSPSKVLTKPNFSACNFGDDLFPSNKFCAIIGSEKTSHCKLTNNFFSKILGSTVTKPSSFSLSSSELALLYVVSGKLTVNEIQMEEGDHLRIEGPEQIDLNSHESAQILLVKMPF